jgi:FtsP/CotA-like multicopper oxidase with cupredoxin domain
MTATKDHRTAAAGTGCQPYGRAIAAAEAACHPGHVNDITLTATTGSIDLGGRTAAAWTYGGTVPRPLLRGPASRFAPPWPTGYPSPPPSTGTGWRCATTPTGYPTSPSPRSHPAESHVYQFTAAQPGTYWLHPHVGTQLERGLYAPLIVADPDDYDTEWVVVLDDWLDSDREVQLATLHRGMAGGMMMGGASSVLLGGDAGDVTYPYYLRRQAGYRVAVNRRSRRLLLTTNTEDSAMAAPAIIGLSRPAAAKGRAATL